MSGVHSYHDDSRQIRINSPESQTENNVTTATTDHWNDMNDLGAEQHLLESV
jgi:cytochrome c556